MAVTQRTLQLVRIVNFQIFSGKKVGIDAFLTAFQFLTTMRDRSTNGDGMPLRDNSRRYVAHLWVSTTHVLVAQRGYNPVYIFDGKLLS